MLSDKNLKEFTSEVASDSPAPGGGSVAALSGSLAAGLLVMFCQLTVGKEKFSQVEEEMQEINEEAEKLRAWFVGAIDKDTEAFNEVMKAFKMPKETQEEKDKRKEAIQEAFKEAATVPLEISENALSVLEKAAQAVDKGNPNAITDLGVACDSALTAFRGGKKNVLINLGSIKDEDFVNNTRQKLSDLENKIEKLYDEVSQKVENQI